MKRCISRSSYLFHPGNCINMLVRHRHEARLEHIACFDKLASFQCNLCLLEKNRGVYAIITCEIAMLPTRSLTICGGHITD